MSRSQWEELAEWPEDRLSVRTAVIKGAMLRCCDRGIKLGQSC